MRTSFFRDFIPTTLKSLARVEKLGKLALLFLISLVTRQHVLQMTDATKFLPTKFYSIHAFIVVLLLLLIFRIIHVKQTEEGKGLHSDMVSYN